MRATIIGAAGMLGAKLAQQIVNASNLNIEALTLQDVLLPKAPDTTIPCNCMRGSFTEPEQAKAIAAERPELIFHLAAIVSGEAEKDFEKGWAINLHGSLHLLEALRAQHLASGGSYRPKVIFTSSIAVFGGPFPDAIDDDFLAAPQTSYGAQKAMTELALADYSRKGFVDGVSLRMPTVVVRPGLPNAAASSFFSGIIREPLAGIEALLPVDDNVRHWFVSPRTATGFLLHAASLDSAKLAGRRSLNLPGVSCTVAEQIQALAGVAGEKCTALIRAQPDAAIIKIIAQWPERFDATKAEALGFVADANFEQIIRVYLEDDAPEAVRQATAKESTA